MLLNQEGNFEGTTVFKGNPVMHDMHNVMRHMHNVMRLTTTFTCRKYRSP